MHLLYHITSIHPLHYPSIDMSTVLVMLREIHIEGLQVCMFIFTYCSQSLVKCSSLDIVVSVKNLMDKRFY